jgi:hypothetical protein
MTLILTCYTEDFVLQVSDRRLVDVQPDGSTRVREDDRTKAIVVDNIGLFAYTGWARIDSQRTHEWFAKKMQPYVDQDHVTAGLIAVRNDLTDWFSRQRVSDSLKLHAFVGAGWYRTTSTKQVHAGADVITNYRDKQGNLLPKPDPEFVLLRHIMRPRNKLRLFAEGIRPPDERILALERMLRRRTFLHDPRQTALVLAHEVRRIANVGGPTGKVGKGLMVACLPKRYALRGGTPQLGEPQGTTLSVHHVPPSGRRQVKTMPVFVRKGSLVMISDAGIDFPPPADGSDPYAAWRKELPVPPVHSRRPLP